MEQQNAKSTHGRTGAGPHDRHVHLSFTDLFEEAAVTQEGL